MKDPSLINRWLRRIVSTLLMVGVFFVAFIGGISVFLNGDLTRFFLTLVFVIVGLVASRLFWI
jgi:magnesium-transporting ATPase (P-type)